MPDLMTTFNFVLEIGGVEMASFRKCSGVESETETIEYKEATKEGKMIIRKVPGAIAYDQFRALVDSAAADARAAGGATATPAPAAAGGTGGAR